MTIHTHILILHTLCLFRTWCTLLLLCAWIQKLLTILKRKTLSPHKIFYPVDGSNVTETNRWQKPCDITAKWKVVKCTTTTTTTTKYSTRMRKERRKNTHSSSSSSSNGWSGKLCMKFSILCVSTILNSRIEYRTRKEE